MQHCSHTVLKVFDAFLPLVHLQPSKIHHCTLLLFGAYSSTVAILTQLQHNITDVETTHLSTLTR